MQEHHRVPIRKIARLIRTAGTDADIARRAAPSPEFRKAVAKDRRAALSRFETVRDALRDRERIAAAKGGERVNAKGAKKRRSGATPRRP
jgi:hypothetical protein